MGKNMPTGTMASRAKANTVRRQKLKTKWDKKCVYETDNLPQNFELMGANFEANLSKTSEENWCRLLDEGIVVDNSMWTGEPEVYAVIRKGTLKKWYDSLPDNFVGTIDKDHNRSIDLGKFTKKDLRLVELEDGRYAIDANVKLDTELYAVKDLLRMNNRTALSVEMFVKADEFASASKVAGEEVEDDHLVPLIDEVKIEGYAVCLAPKSANSYKDDLLINASIKEEDMSEVKEDIEVKAEDLEAEVEAVEEVEETEVETTEETTDEAETTEAETDTDETDEDEAEEVEETEATETTTEGEGEDKLDQLEAAIADLKANLEAKDKEIADLKAKLDAKNKAEMSSEDRVAALLKYATLSATTEAEGNATTKNEDSVVDIYRSAFKESN